MPFEFDDLAQDLLTASRTASRGITLPRRELSMDQAYAVQRVVAEHSRTPILVWKLGLTSPVAQQHFGTNEPTIGRLPASAIYSDRSEITYRGPEMFAEAELVFELGHDLPMLDRPYTRDDISCALKGLYAGIEIVRTRFVTSELTLPLLVSDNVMAHGLVLGRKLAAGWNERFADLSVSLVRNARELASGGTALVMGNPLDAVVWLANWLRTHEGRPLQREQLIASGTCTGATEIFAGDTIRADFDGVEGVHVTLRKPDE